MILFAFGTPRKEPVVDLRKISISTRYISFLVQFNVKYVFGYIPRTRGIADMAPKTNIYNIYPKFQIYNHHVRLSLDKV